MVLKVSDTSEEGKMKYSAMLCASFLALAFSQNASAGSLDLPNVQVVSISIIATPVGGHLAGNMEIKLATPFVAPPGTVTCPDHSYITTLQKVDPDRAMLSLLLQRATTTTALLHVGLRITDDLALKAYPGRCSLEVVTLG
jgi:hypothetical protein